MIVNTETLSTIAQITAAREAEAADMNAERLVSWQRRYPRDVVHVPTATQPPQWPCRRPRLRS